MYIKGIYIKNYRRFNEVGTEFKFQKGINVIIGENNAGKSSLIDAIRLCLTSGQYRKDLFVNISDFHIDEFGIRAEDISIDVFFGDLSIDQGVAFYHLTDGKDTSKAEIHIKYHIQKDSKGNERVKDSIKGGPLNNPIVREVFDNINLIYMAALRDAERDMKPAKKSRLANLLTTVAANEEDKERLVLSLRQANKIIEKDESIVAIQTAINKNLNLIEKEELSQNIKINLIQPSFEAIAGSLNAWNSVTHNKIKIELDKFEEMLAISDSVNSELTEAVIERNAEFVIMDISNIRDNKVLKEVLVDQYVVSSDISLKQNGLGYNNILSMATSLSDLQIKPTVEELSVFLVEEPEAHLHPQLLELVFNYLKNTDENSKVQMFLTSHSPALISKADIDSLNILHEKDEVTFSSSLAECCLNDNEKEDLKRYLDVTKSQLFFAKRVMFVEGITEAILITEFAKLINKPLDKFSVEIVNINGVSFEPFAKLFSKNDLGNHLKHHCAIISDDDRCTNKEDSHRILKDELIYTSVDINAVKSKLAKGELSYRAQNLKNFDSDNIKVLLANKTLEYEIAIIEENNVILLDVLSRIHPIICDDIKAKIAEGACQEDVAIRIWIAIRDCKGVFAQRLASEISKINSITSSYSTFIVPNYIKNAIDWLVK